MARPRPCVLELYFLILLKGFWKAFACSTACPVFPSCTTGTKSACATCRSLTISLIPEYTCAVISIGGLPTPCSKIRPHCWKIPHDVSKAGGQMQTTNHQRRQNMQYDAVLEILRIPRSFLIQKWGNAGTVTQKNDNPLNVVTDIDKQIERDASH